MKKLLTLLLVLSLASTASAALSLGGATTVVQGGTAIVTISSDNANAWTAYVDDTDGSVGTLGAVTAVTALPAAGDDAAVVLTAGYAYAIDAADAGEPFNIASGIQFNLTVSAGSHAVDDVITITLYADDWSEVIDTQAVTVITPEPMTIALLGLGGLFLRRRK
jgi:hypothetical protein